MNTHFSICESRGAHLSFVCACRLHIPTLVDETHQEFGCAMLGKVSYFKWLLLGIGSIHVQVLAGTPPKSFLPCQIHLTWFRYVLLRIYLCTWLHQDLRVPTLFLFQSISIFLHANTYLLALQSSYMYLFSFPTQRWIVCTPVPCSHPHLFHPMQTAALVTDTLQPPSQ